ncbi:hypothetical protein AVEN_200241-1 [Araneus ventricosus]|uniref:Gustatory receptor n=1 Tax=Araneus ventricosus TaxID=182803 RepID=A0A4Y2DR46_ARAVE|nr:hypothetical protein AVEN_200241-1 [Araneus ventricosus]
MLLLALRVLQLFLAASQTYHFPEETSMFWTFGYVFKEREYQIAVSLMGEYIYNTVFFEFPCITTLAYCLLIKQCVFPLCQFKTNLKSLHFDMLLQKGFKILRAYNILEENIRLLKQMLSTPMFAILLSCSMNLYSALDMSLGEEEIPLSLIASQIILAFIPSIVIVSLITCSSKIPEAIQQIKETAGILIEKNHLSTLSKGKDVSFLERLEKKEEIFLSAGGMVDLKKGLMLSIVGAFLTYGFLILNLDYK